MDKSSKAQPDRNVKSSFDFKKDMKMGHLNLIGDNSPMKNNLNLPNMKFSEDHLEQIKAL